MVKKLIKYDFVASAKVMLPIEIATLGVALLYRIVSFFENDSVFYEIFNVSTIVILSIAVITALIMTFIYSVVRFYRNLFTSEGYLSLTLPVTPAAHIASKLIVALIFDVITVLVAICAASVAMAGEVLVEVVKAGAYLFGIAARVIGGQTALYMIEIALLVIVASATAHLLTYMCISIGQLVHKHKILLALGVYFGIYVVKQIVGTFFVAGGATNGFFVDLIEYIAENPRTSAHMFLLIAIFVECVFGALYYIVSSQIIKRRLNLE